MLSGEYTLIYFTFYHKSSCIINCDGSYFSVTNSTENILGITFPGVSKVLYFLCVEHSASTRHVLQGL